MFISFCKANSLASDMKGRVPILSKVLKTASSVRGVFTGGRNNSNNSNVPFSASMMNKDQNAAIQTIASNHRRTSTNRLSLSDPHSMNDENHFVTNNDDIENYDVSIVESKQFSSNHSDAKFAYIITRPTTFLRDGPTVKKLSASKSVRVTFRDVHFMFVICKITFLLKLVLF